MKTPLENRPSKEMIPDPRALIDYVNDHLSAADKRDLEELINDDPFVGDAVEGLLQLDQINDLDSINQSLTQIIDRRTQKKKIKTRDKTIGFPLWLILLITLTLLTILGGYVVISLLNK